MAPNEQHGDVIPRRLLVYDGHHGRIIGVEQHALVPEERAPKFGDEDDGKEFFDCEFNSIFNIIFVRYHVCFSHLFQTGLL